MSSKQGKSHKYYILPQDKGFQSEGLLPNPKLQGNVMEMGHGFPEFKILVCLPWSRGISLALHSSPGSPTSVAMVSMDSQGYRLEGSSSAPASVTFRKGVEPYFVSNFRKLQFTREMKETVLPTAHTVPDPVRGSLQHQPLCSWNPERPSPTPPDSMK